MRNIIIFVLICLLSGCGPWFAGGGKYIYKTFDPATNATIEMAVESAREVEYAKIHFAPDGTIEDIEIKGIQPGPDNMAQALGIIDNLIKAGALAATP